MAGNFTWLSLSNGIAQLGARLAAPLTDPPTSLWSATEGKNYIFRALQQFNILTNTWRADFTFNSPSPGTH